MKNATKAQRHEIIINQKMKVKRQLSALVSLWLSPYNHKNHIKQGKVVDARGKLC